MQTLKTISVFVFTFLACWFILSTTTVYMFGLGVIGTDLVRYATGIISIGLAVFATVNGKIT